MLIYQILGISLGLGFLIFIHELGHFTGARLCKVRVLTFAFGFGPDLIKYVYKGTKYCIKAIPFGGFVSMAGDNPEGATGGEDEYLSLPWYKKIFISFVGPFSNYILAAVMFCLIFNIYGVSTVSNAAKIGGVGENYPSAAAGLLNGDVIKAIDGVNITLWSEISDNLKDKADKQTSFVIERGSSTFEITMTVAKNPATGAGLIGVSPYISKEKAGFFKSVIYGVEAPITQSVMTVAYLADKLFSLEKPDIAGPIGIMQVMGSAVKSGTEDYLRLIAIISVALGLFNLFPIPFVDGGMIVLYIVEGIKRKAVGLKAIQIYNTVGLVLICGVFIFATYSDLLRLGVGRLFGK
ncbi:MAG: M50 family metallopeptidase [Endomicrobium sp.]|jgi:regulator of sigma E protease|nr:M50 family metallopeptidase [Endomicrobium sp.]